MLRPTAVGDRQQWALVLGADGRVGRVLSGRGVGGATAAFGDRAELDARDDAALAQACVRYGRWVLLASELRFAALDPAAESERAAALRTAHVQLARQVIVAAITGGVAQLVLPSSVHVADAVREGRPPAPAGSLSHVAMNLALEAAGEAAAASGLDVVCLRLGAVNWPDAPARGAAGRAHWLSHEDCAAAFAAILAAPVQPGRFVRFAVASRLAGGLYEDPNPFGWRPRTTAVGWRRRVGAGLVALRCRVEGWPGGPALRRVVHRLRAPVGSALRAP